MPKLLLPILRLIVWAVIATALVYLAFFRDVPEPKADPYQPSVSLTSPTVPVMRGDVANQVTLTGSLNARPATTVKSTAGGAVGVVKVKVGDAVSEGTVLFTVKVPIEQTQAPEPAGPSAAAPTSQAPKFTVKEVKSTTTGKVATLDVLPDQEVQIGTAVATISSGLLDVQAQLTPENQYRLPTIPSTASISVTGGPAPFQCSDLHVVPPSGSTGNEPATVDPMTGQPTGGGITVQCSVPPGTAVYAGSPATIAIDAGTATGVLVLPVTAVDGKTSPGRVWVVGPDGSDVETPVELGITDGVMIEIKSGLQEGQEVLEFTPQQQEVPMDDGSGKYGVPGGYGG